MFVNLAGAPDQATRGALCRAGGVYGRFLQVDPVGYEDEVNLYGYVANDPINGIDPNGREIVGPRSATERARLEIYINARAQGVYRFRGRNHSLTLVSGTHAQGLSSYYAQRLNKGIGSSQVINLHIATEVQVTGYEQPFVVDALGGGMTYRDPITGAIETTISGNPSHGVFDTNGNELRDEPADILAHELVSHAIPQAIGSDTGNAIDEENKVRGETGGGTRAPDRCHVENSDNMPSGC